MKKSSSAALVSIALLLCLQYSCGNGANKPVDAVAEGEKLAREYCVSCHIFPEPALLDKNAWVNGVLPMMAQLMNQPDLYSHSSQGNGTAQDSKGNGTVQDSATGATLPKGAWEKIVAYYRSSAPETLGARKDTLSPVSMELPLFSHFSFYGRFANPMTTLVFIDSVNRKIYFADGNAGKVYATNIRFSSVDSFTTSPGATDIHPDKQNSVVAIGSITPSDLPKGRMEMVRPNGQPATVLANLRRPVQAVYADLNADGQEDIIVA